MDHSRVRFCYHELQHGPSPFRGKRGADESHQAKSERRLGFKRCHAANPPRDLGGLAVKRMLSTLPLPLKFIETIMEFAEYWPCTYTKTKDSAAVLSDDNVAIMIGLAKAHHDGEEFGK